MALTMSRLGVSLCLLNGVVEDKRFLRVVSEAIIVSHESYLTTFVKGPPPRNGSKYVKNGGFLMPLNGVVEDRRFLMMVSRGSYQIVQVQTNNQTFYAQIIKHLLHK